MCSNRNQMDITDRFVIETGLAVGKSFRAIAKDLDRHPNTIAREVRNNRTHSPNTSFMQNNCRYLRTCSEKNLCANCDSTRFCKTCIRTKCFEVCPRYVVERCPALDHPPYVCNHCIRRMKCEKDKFFYNAHFADRMSIERRSSSRSGLRIRDDELEALDEFVSSRIRLGQPLSHIFAEHGEQLPITLRSMYNYIDSGKMTIKNIDLRRKVKYRRRRKKKDMTPLKHSCREGRTYADFNDHIAACPWKRIVQMDTVRGSREKSKVILTMLFVDTNVMLMFLLPDGRAQSVVEVFDDLYLKLGLNRFRNLFPVILTDNGSEFKSADELEYYRPGEKRCRVFYCDPLASWQKGELEKNHEYIRYIIPKGKDFNDLTDADMTLMMNHINSTKRLGLGKRCPYDLIGHDDEDFQVLMHELKLDIIPPDDVQLTPSLIK